MHFTPAQLRVIKGTVARDTNQTEFDLFLEACRSYGLDPFRKQIHAVVYSKDNAEKRKMSIIVSRDGLRVLAHRCKDYRPASEPAQIVSDEAAKGPTNPKGLISATVRLWKQDRSGEWFPVIGEAHWDEFAPVKEAWAFDEESRRRKPTGNLELEQGNWSKMPIVMLTKCAESQALRAGWPETFGGLYAEEELHAASASATASEELAQFEMRERQAKIGGPAVMFAFDDSMSLDRVPVGAIADRLSDFIGTATPEEVMRFRIRNEPSLREFWAHSKSDALAIKKLIEAKEQQFRPGTVA